MKRLKSAMAGALSLAFAAGGLAVVLAGPAYATTTAPPWEPDAATANYGNIVFYDANGNVVTSGNNLSQAFAYAVGTTGIDTGATKASLSFADPVKPSSGSVNPFAQFGNSAASGTTTWSAMAGTTPADIAADLNNFPVVQTGNGTTSPGANIASWIGAGHTNDPNPGYSNTIQVRLTDSGAAGVGNPSGTYWDADIAYNNTSSPITVDGYNVPANSWVQLFPFQSSSTTSLATNATGGHATSSGGVASITLTATVSTTPATPNSGSVMFFDNGTYIPSSITTVSGGTAAFTYNAANGNHSYTASFVPGQPPGDETTPNTNTATQLPGSQSSAVAVSVTPPQTATTTSLVASPANPVAYQANVTLTSTTTAADNSTAGATGSVQFEDGGANLGAPVNTTVTGSGTSASPGTGTAQLVINTLSPGNHTITAVFTPTSNTYANSTGGPVTVTVSAPQACSQPGSSCSDTQNIQVVVSPGSITITTPYTSNNPFVLPQMALSADGTYFQSQATFPKATDNQIVVTSSLAPAYAWTLSVSATPLTSSGGGTIPASGLGLTNGTLENSSGTGAYPGSVTFTNLPAHNPSPVDTDTNSGLTSSPQSWGHSTAADGTAVMDGTLTLFAATNTPSGTYNGTLTFSVS